jgi:Arc/MetJ family transcription regulator
MRATRGVRRMITPSQHHARRATATHSGASGSTYGGLVIFKKVGEGRPYPEHGKQTPRDWADVPPRLVRLEQLVTTKRTLDLGHLLAEDSTFYGDLFAHVVEWEGTLYLEDGLHRALRAALQQRPTLHARVLVLD